MRFYSLTLREVRELTSEDNQMLWLAIDQLEAQETLIGLTASAYPNMKDKSREKLFATVRDKAYPPEVEAKVYSTEELGQILSAKLGR